MKVKVQGTIVTLLCFLIGGMLIWRSENMTGTTQVFLQSIGSLVITSGAFAWWGAYVARMEIASLLTEGFGLNSALKEAGIRDVIPWRKLEIPDGARKVDIVVIRAVGFFKLQATQFKEILRRQESEVRICYVHSKSKVVASLAQKFQEEEEELRMRIVESILEIVRQAEEGKPTEKMGRLQIRAHNLLPHHTYYRFDEESYFVWYPLRRGRVDLPVLRLGEGKIRMFLQDDFERFWAESDTEAVYDSAIDANKNRDALLQIGARAEALAGIFGNCQPTN